MCAETSTYVEKAEKSAGKPKTTLKKPTYYVDKPTENHVETPQKNN